MCTLYFSMYTFRICVLNDIAYLHVVVMIASYYAVLAASFKIDLRILDQQQQQQQCLYNDDQQRAAMRKLSYDALRPLFATMTS
jgi:hypothetical protein